MARKNADLKNILQLRNHLALRMLRKVPASVKFCTRLCECRLQGFPTIVYLSYGKNRIDYSGEHETEALVSFVESGGQITKYASFFILLAIILCLKFKRFSWCLSSRYLLTKLNTIRLHFTMLVRQNNKKNFFYKIKLKN